MRRKFLIILTGLVILFFISCEEKTGIMEQQPEVFSIQPASVPTRLNVSQTKTYSISFKVTHPNGSESISNVSVTFYSSNQSDVLLTTDLYDDGRVNHPGDKDVIAKDGIFTNTFQSDSLIFPLGDVYIKATALDNSQQQIQTDFISSLSLLNKAPVLVSISAPDTLPSGSDAVLFSVVIQDSNGIEDVPSVTMRLKQQNFAIFSTTLNLLSSTDTDSGSYGAYFDSSFAAERIGSYDLEFQTMDLSGDSSNKEVKSIYLENLSPGISNVQLPDSVQRPSAGEDTIVVSLLANDHQGLDDIDIVAFNIFRIGGDTTSIEMFDDGDFANHRDEKANDGVYSRGLTLTPQNLAATFYFIFQAKDKVNNFSTTVIDSMVIQ